MYSQATKENEIATMSKTKLERFSENRRNVCTRRTLNEEKLT